MPATIRFMSPNVYLSDVLYGTDDVLVRLADPENVAEGSDEMIAQDAQGAVVEAFLAHAPA